MNRPTFRQRLDRPHGRDVAGVREYVIGRMVLEVQVASQLVNTRPAAALGQVVEYPPLQRADAPAHDATPPTCKSFGAAIGPCRRTGNWPASNTTMSQTGQPATVVQRIASASA